VTPLKVQVVSLDWKWLFIYPDQGVASVNQLTVPVGTPISFELTSIGAMNSFFVPQLGSQIYTMAGMMTRVQLQADQAGTYRGLSANFSGDGFARYALCRRCRVGVGIRTVGARRASRQHSGLDAQTYADLARPVRRSCPSPITLSLPLVSTGIVNAGMPGQTPSQRAEK